ncbi:MAG: ParB/RepB/Spo0J family partition protein [Planctomycetes bacterium]|nr:ParB/RepB/Spo0J family partition protein [Planctomycetota bacterium]
MERRLGRGLSALLTQSNDALPPSAELEPRAREELPLDAIRTNPFQPRVNFDPAGLEELVQSIRQHGLLQPIVVRQQNDGYQLISGERRLRAFRELGRTSIPASIRTGVSDAEMLELALVENLQRRDLDPIERALGYRRMIQDLGLTQEQVADRVGLQRPTVANHLRLLDLPEVAQQALAKGLIQMGHARAILACKDPGLSKKLVERTVRDDLSVREVEALVRKRAPEPEQAVDQGEPIKVVVPQAPWVRDLEDRMRAHLGTKVQLKNGPGYRGQIVIEYFQREDLERLAEVLAPRERLM